MLTCWLSLHETTADAGPVAYVPGSHRWPVSPPERSQFHAPEDWLAPARTAAPDGVAVETARRSEARRRLVPPRSLLARLGSERERHRRPDGARVAHDPGRGPLHHEQVDLNYSRYRKRGDLSLDESFFPVMWHETGYRTPWLAELPVID